MAMQMVTDSMRAHAEVLRTRSARWCKGHRLSDGLPIYLFRSSRTNADGNPVLWETRQDGLSCNCPSFVYRSACSHALAVQIADTADQLLDEYDDYETDIELAFATVAADAGARQSARFSRSYRDLFPDDDR